MFNLFLLAMLGDLTPLSSRATKHSSRDQINQKLSKMQILIAIHKNLGKPRFGTRNKDTGSPLIIKLFYHFFFFFYWGGGQKSENYTSDKRENQIFVSRSSSISFILYFLILNRITCLLNLCLIHILFNH